MVRPEIVITGFGAVSGLGGTAAQFVAAVRQGTSALTVGAVHQAQPSEGLAKLRALADGACGLASGSSAVLARVGDFGASAAIDAGRRRRMPRLGQMAIVAAQQALGWQATGAGRGGAAALDRYGADRIGIVLGTALGALDLTMEFVAQWIEHGLHTASPATFPYTVLNTPAALIAMELGLRGPNVTVNHRDLSAFEALATACDLLRMGRLDAVIAGGTDELSDALLHAYARLGALPRQGAGPSLPYDRRRTGLNPGEGAMLFLLERADAAAARGVTPWATVLGYGRAGADRARVGWHAAQGHVGAPPADSAQAVDRALNMAGCAPQTIDFVAGAGNGTALDRLETQVLRAALGEHAERVPIASLLWQTGDWPTSTAARVGQALVALRDQVLPGGRCDVPDPDAALPGVCRHEDARAATVNRVLLPVLAQGGGSGAIILGRA